MNLLKKCSPVCSRPVSTRPVPSKRAQHCQTRRFLERVYAADADAIENPEWDAIQGSGALGHSTQFAGVPTDTAPVETPHSVADSCREMMEETRTFLESDLKKLFEKGVS